MKIANADISKMKDTAEMKNKHDRGLQTRCPLYCPNVRSQGKQILII